MSDLYLVLRSRLESVPEWVFIDRAVLQAARESRGLSYETTARELHVSSKTWERYEKAGRVPRPLVPQVATVLGLEIEEPEPRRVVIEPAEVRIAALDELRGHIDERFDDLERMVELLIPDGDRAAARSPRAAARAAAEEAAQARAALEELPRRTRETG